MPIPLVIWAGVAVAGAFGARKAQRALRQPINLLVLGQRRVGKTTLLNSWRGEWDPEVPRTNAPVKLTPIRVKTGTTVLDIEKKFVFRNVVDFSGNDAALGGVSEQLPHATAVLYLLKATTLLAEELRRSTPDQPQGAEMERVQLDMARLATRLPVVQRIVLVVTHTDQDFRYRDMAPDAYTAHLQAQLVPVLGALTSDSRVRFAMGSMADEQRARELCDEIVQRLL